MMDSRTIPIPVQLSDETVIQVEVTPIGEQQVAFGTRSFQDIKTVVTSISKDIAETLQNVHKIVKPDKISVKFGVEIGVESGQLTALLAKGAGKANLEISMEWDK